MKVLNLDTLGVQILGYELLHGLGRGGGYLAGLEDDGVARGDGGQHGRHRQQEREVPGPDDQSGAVGFGMDVNSVKQRHGTLVTFSVKYQLDFSLKHLYFTLVLPNPRYV